MLLFINLNFFLQLIVVAFSYALNPSLYKNAKHDPRNTTTINYVLVENIY